MATYQKIMLIISVLLVAAFGFVLHNDWVQYNLQFSEILETLNLTSSDMQGSFAGIVIVRCIEFLMPALVLSFCALVIWYKENLRPDEIWPGVKKRKTRKEERSERQSG